MALTKAKLIADNAVKAVHIDETDTGITLAQLNVTGDITASSGTITASAFVGDGSGITGVSSDYTVSEISTNTTAVANNLYVLTASLTLTLPASPQVGDKVAVSNMSGTTTPVIARNGSLILGLAEDLTINVENISVEFIYSGATEGWVVFTDSILGYASVDTIDGSGTTNYISKWSDADTLTDSIIFDNGTNVGIGTSSPTAKFSVSDPTYLSNSAVVGSKISLNSENTASWTGTRELIAFESVGNGAEHRTGTLSIKLKATNTATTLTENIQINPTFGFTNFSFGGTEVARITTNGLTFNGDTAAANALDDYEEGTWTPTLLAGGVEPSGISYSVRSGTYVKIGKKVTLWVSIKVNSKGTGSGEVEIGGLPFTVANIAAYKHPMGAGTILKNNTEVYVSLCTTTRIFFRRLTSAADTPLGFSELDNATFILQTITHEV